MVAPFPRPPVASRSTYRFVRFCLKVDISRGHLKMYALGPKQTSVLASHMSAFGGKAGMIFCGSPLLPSLLGVKRTCPFALHMSANDPKRTCSDCGSMFAFGVKADNSGTTPPWV